MVDVEDQDLKIARQLLVELVREQPGRKPLTDKTLQLAERVISESPAARHLEQAEGAAAAQQYSRDVMTQAKQQLIDQAKQAKPTQQHSRGGGMER